MTTVADQNVELVPLSESLVSEFDPSEQAENVELDEREAADEADPVLG